MGLKYLKYIVLSFIIVSFSACSNKKAQLDVNKRPKMQVPKVVEAPKRKKGSLYSRKGNSLFSDKRDLQVGDIIQIRIEESLTNDSNGKRELKRNNNSNLGGGLFGSGYEPTKGAAKKLNGLVNLNFQTQSSGSMKNEYKRNSSEEFSTVVSGIIEQTYQNGNYFVVGTKDMLINGQKQTIKISGVIRPYDISVDNTISSTQIANLKIYYLKDGEDSQTLEKGWGSKIIDTIWPF